jgi:hypothetical protein
LEEVVADLLVHHLHCLLHQPLIVLEKKYEGCNVNYQIFENINVLGLRFLQEGNRRDLLDNKKVMDLMIRMYNKTQKGNGN